MESSNSYQRAIQYQQLEKEQFQAKHPPGFFHSVGCDFFTHDNYTAMHSMQRASDGCLRVLRQ